jgi:penicillin-binding protein 2
MNDGGLSTQALVARLIAILIFVGLAMRLFYIQIIDDKYDELAENNYLRNVVVYPPRGEIYDRNGELLAQNRLCYDVTIVRKDMPEAGFDTTRLCEVIGMTRKDFEKNLKQAPYGREGRLTR